MLIYHEKDEWVTDLPHYSLHNLGVILQYIELPAPRRKTAKL